MLCVYPLLLGPGKHLSTDSPNPRELTIVRTNATPTGVLLNTYRYLESPQA